MGKTANETERCIVYQRGDETGGVLVNPHGAEGGFRHRAMPWSGAWADAEPAVFEDRNLARRWRDYVRRFRAPNTVKIVRPSVALALRVLANI